MKQSLFGTAVRSLWFNRKDAFYQVIIISILAAIISGSLMTGDSVRSSLAKSLDEKLGNSDLLISSGSRYFTSSIDKRIAEKTGAAAVSLLENDGYCRNFTTGTTALHTKIFGIGKEFFRFHGIDQDGPGAGEVFINERLSTVLGTAPGDEVIVSFTEVDPIPSNAPFAPKGGNENSKVLRIAKILSGSQGGNFSLGTSQVVPQNIFVSLNDMETSGSKKIKANRLLIHTGPEKSGLSYLRALEEILTPSDIGLSIRISAKTGEPEIISDRIFIDVDIAGEITRNTPGAKPVITYLANSMTVAGKTTPYSFLSGLPEDMSGVKGKDEILISRWLADDLGAKEGDSLRITWYDPGMGRRLSEKTKNFIISGIAGNDYKYSDPSLMPDFPGISGSATCSGWDAGVPILLGSIRAKDEKYWNLYRGTPKAFINYETGRLLWGNNFGSATAFRYSNGTDTSLIVNKLTGHINPLKAGFTLISLREKNREAASQGVDFGTLFLGLSFFIILSCIVLLSISLSLFFDSRKEQVRTYNALGFKQKSISVIISSEALFISVTGALLGVVLGCLVNYLMIKGLNSVWRGAVQTDTLTAGISLLPLLSGFMVTVMISSIMVSIKLGRHLKNLALSARKIHRPGPGRFTGVLVILFFILSLLLFLSSVIMTGNAILLSFAGGAFLFTGFIMALLWFYSTRPGSGRTGRKNYSRLYYAFNPSHAVTPALFLAAGIFAVIITGANRQTITGRMLLPPGGTGGFLLWAESAIPVRYSLESPQGRKEFGFDEPELKDLTFVEARRISGDDASCLNISHVTSPPVLGLDPVHFIQKGSFSFATRIRKEKEKNPWDLLKEPARNNTIYGIADQTVLEWGLKIKTGDTLKYAAESGEVLNIVICAGLQSSVFQGYVITGLENFNKYFPSVRGGSVFLADGKRELTSFYISTISDRMAGAGMAVEPAAEKLASFFTVTNTYLQVFMMLGAFGLILGAAGLGFILRRNFNSRKHEFALMLSAGYTTGRIRSMLLRDQFIILLWGIVTGTVSALTATWPSVRQGSDLPWLLIIIMIAAMLLTGMAALLLSVNGMNREKLVPLLRKE